MPTLTVPLRILSVLMLAVVSAAGHSQSPDFERIAPQQPAATESGDIRPPLLPVPEQENNDQVLVSALTGLRFIDSLDKLASVMVSDGLTTDVSQLEAELEFRSQLSPFLEQPLTLALLDQISISAVNYFRAHDYPVVDVFPPEGQDITSGRVQFVVLIGRLGEVEVEGEEYFSDMQLRRGIRLNADDPIRLSSLEEDLAWLNNNPFRSVNAVFEPGAAFSTTDLVLRVEDRRPVRVFAGVEDTGTQMTGNNRAMAGINWGNAFGRDQQLSYQYSSSFETEVLNAHSVTWQAPLPWRHTLSVFGSYVNSNPPANSDGFDLQGRSWQLGLRYSLPVSLLQLPDEQLQLGMDFKRSNNDLQFGNLNVFSNFTDIVQFSGNWSTTLSDQYGFTSIGLGLTWSPGGISANNDDNKFAATREQASADYMYSRLDVNRLTRLPAGLAWAANLHMQFSDGNLLGSEQLGIGGYQTVRGYDEYASIGDEGFTLRNELRTSAKSLLGMNNADDSLQWLGFLDYGKVSNVDTLSDERDSEMFSVGVGLRYTLGSLLTLRADYGWQLKEAAPGLGKDSRAHFSVVFGY